MRLTLLKEEGIWRMSELLEIQLDFMRMAADDAALGDFPEGHGRLYPPPMAAKEAYQEEEFIGDWKEYVSSDLEMRFAGDLGTFLSDLDEARETGVSEESGERLFVLDVPLDHGPAWYSTFNQARLMLDLKHKLYPEEQFGDETPLEDHLLESTPPEDHSDEDHLTEDEPLEEHDHNFEDEHLSDGEVSEESAVRETPPFDFSPARVFVLMRFRFYEWIQDWMVTHVL